MKTFKFLKLFSLTAFAAGAFAVANGKSSKQAEVVKADPAPVASGKLVAKLGNIGKWSDQGAKLTAYLTDDTSSEWLPLQVMESSKPMYVFSYSVSFTPTKLIWVRMNPSETEGSWGEGKKWNQTGDLALHDATYLSDDWDPSASNCSQWDLFADVKTSKDGFTNPKVTFDVNSVEIMAGDQPQLSGKVTLEANEEFKVVNRADNVWSAFYDCPDALDSAFEGGSKEYQSPDLSNIVCKIPGTYDFYFNTETKKIWISNDAIVQADGWATYFNSNVGCDDDGVKLPTGWFLCATAYGALDPDTKDYIYSAKADKDGDNLARALSTYDYAVSHHSTLEKFIKSSTDVVRASLSLEVGHAFSANDSRNLIMIVSIVSLVSASTLVGLIVLKRRKGITK